MKSTLLIGALAVFLLLPQRAPGQERLKWIYSQFTMTNSATWFAREAGLFERHGLNADPDLCGLRAGGAGHGLGFSSLMRCDGCKVCRALLRLAVNW
jgi:hypothetical protein